MTRNKTLDISKGILIILMVMAHTQFWGHDFIFLFHMGSFFIISGYFFDKKNINTKDDIKKYIIKKIKSLYLPFLLWNMFFLVINNILFLLNITTSHFSLLTTLKKAILIICFYGRTELSDSTWFFQSLFWIAIIYMFINFIFKDRKNQTLIVYIISIFLSILGYIFYKINFNIYQIGTIFSCIILYHIGNELRKVDFSKLKNKKNINILICISSIFLSIIYLFINEYVIRVMQNQIYNPIIFIISSVLGFLVVYCISCYFEKNSKLNQILSFLGKNTIPILTLHIVSFKIITFIQILYYKTSFINLNKVPVYISDWWILYTLVGVICPVIYVLLKNYIYQNKKKTLLDN